MNGEMKSGLGFDEPTPVTQAGKGHCCSVLGEDNGGGQR